MKLLWVVTFLSLTFGAPLFADPFCDDLFALSQNKINGTLSMPAPLSQQTATCSASLGLAGARYSHCHWVFPYRSAAATEAFEQIISELAKCLGDQVVQTSDVAVNHPDVFDMRLFVVDGRDYAVSLKDKGALQQTLVFVRVMQTP